MRSLTRSLPILVVAVMSAAAGVVALLALGRGQEQAGSSRPEPGAELQTVQRELVPDPRLGPDEVVTFQITALRLGGKGEMGIRRCYRFASPLNRSATGPIERFVRMIRSRPYNVMLSAVDTLVGKAVVREDRARVLVTLIDPMQDVRVFRFFLSKQRESPYAGCWMTDAVREVIFDASAPPGGGAAAPAAGI